MSTVVFHLPAYLEGSRVIVFCLYDTRAPWTVRLTFPTVPVVVRPISRGAIACGLLSPWGRPDPAGKDVYVERTGDHVALHLVESDSRGDFALEALFDKAPLSEALRTTYLMVSHGQETRHMDWDTGLRALGGVA